MRFLLYTIHKGGETMSATFSGTKLRCARTSKKLSQADVAERAETTIRYFGAVERGEKKNPSAAWVCRVSNVLGISMNDLMDISRESEELE